MGIDRYAVIGHHIGYSRSPQIHAAFARGTGQVLEYGLIDVEPASFDAAVRQFVAAGGRGLNVTVPYKLRALELVTTLTPRAQRAGAVNTLSMGVGVGVGVGGESVDGLANPSLGQLSGDNTDGAGLLRDLTANLRFEIRDARVLLLGAGGAARGILGPLLAAGPAVVHIRNRTQAHARQLAAQFADLGPVHALLAARTARAYDLILNAISGGGEDALLQLSLPTEAADASTLCYDLSYGAVPTPFGRWAHACGSGRVVDGLGMLVEQAAESFLVWRGVRPDTGPVLAALEHP